MKALTIIAAILIAVFISTNVLAEPVLSVGTTKYAIVGALYDAGDYLLIGTEFGITKLHKATGDIEFYCDRLNDLPSERVSALTIDKEGNIWIGYTDKTHYEEIPGGGGLAKLDENNVVVFRFGTSDLPKNSIKSLAVDDVGNLWVGTYNGGLVKYNGTTMTVYDLSNSDIPNNVVNDIAVDNDGDIVIGTNYGIGIFDGETWSSYNKLNSGIPSNFVRCVSTDNKGNVWTGTGSGAARFDGETWTVYKKEDYGLATDGVKGLDIDAQGKIWICTADGIALYDKESWKAYSGDSSTLSDNEILSFAVDPEGNAWVGIDDCLLQFDGETWKEHGTGTLTGRDTWSRRINMPTARQGHSVCTVSGKIYAIGGATTSAGLVVSTVEEYDPVTDKWITKAEMLTDRSWLSCCVVNGKIYACGGYDGEESYGITTVEEYDPVTDTWTTKSPMPTGRWALGTFAVNGKIYAIGGSDDSPALAKYLGTVDEYDPVTNTWTTKSPMPTARSCYAAVVNGRIYAIGGKGNQATYSTVEEYDPATDTWTSKSPMPTARWGHATSAINGKIYTIGGAEGYPITMNYRTVEEYDPATDTWTTKSPSPIPTDRAYLLSCVINGKIYIIGPSYPGSYSEVYVYDPGGQPTWVDDMIPVGFALDQNYPNPFNPGTTINYRLEQEGKVNLVIYDLLGQKVATLVDEVKTPGNYEVTWNAASHANGMYFCRIELGDSKVLTQKMMLVK